MTRKMRDVEQQKFEAAFGYAPTYIEVAFDALALFVHADNPIAQRGLTLAELDAMYSSTRNAGAPADLTHWGQLGLTGPWQQRAIVLYARNPASFSYGRFKSAVLKKGNYKSSVIDHPGSASIAHSVRENPGSIGYASPGYLIEGVQTVPLRLEGQPEAVSPSSANIMTERYPLSRPLYIAVNLPPGKAIDPAMLAWFRFVLSGEGQHVVVRDGYIPLPPLRVAAQLKKLEAVGRTP